MHKKFLWPFMAWLGLCGLLVSGALPAAHAASAAPGVLVVAPDRGFLGNLEIEDAFARFAGERNAALLYMVDERSEAILDERLAALRAGGAEEVIVLPLFVDAQAGRWQLAASWLEARAAAAPKLHIEAPYGTSWLAAEDLSARLRDAGGDQQRLLLVASDAADGAHADALAAQLHALAERASTLDAAAIDVAVMPAWRAPDAATLRARAEAQLQQADGALVVPIGLWRRSDSMMDAMARVPRQLPAGARWVDTPTATADQWAQWMRWATHARELGMARPTADEVGVVVLAHGADWFWNHHLQLALAPVAEKYQLAFAFSMADQPTVEHAVRELEERGVRGIIVVRAFGMASSFLPDIERMLGLDAGGAAAHGGMMMDHGHDDAALGAPARIRSAVPMVTVGGVEDAPEFAHALLESARSVATQPARETVILVAHGAGADADNAHWLGLLRSLATQMHAFGGSDFRAIRFGTWREDWPDKREQAVADVRAMVTEAQADGGHALIIPARVNGRGAAARWLEGMDFVWSTDGFVQSPWFARWVAAQIEAGMDSLHAFDQTGARQAATASPPAHHHSTGH